MSARSTEILPRQPARSCAPREAVMKKWKDWLVPPVLFPVLLVVGILPYAWLRP